MSVVNQLGFIVLMLSGILACSAASHGGLAKFVRKSEPVGTCEWCILFKNGDWKRLTLVHRNGESIILEDNSFYNGWQCGRR